MDEEIKNAIFDDSIKRGMQYYTGIVFEIYDVSKENTRALFGGGRYDNLLDIFGAEKVAATGFGMGDVGIQNVLETYGLLPNIPSVSKLYLCVMNKDLIDYAQDLARKIRDAGVNVSLDYSAKKVGDQIKYADKNKIPYVVVIGEEEAKTGKLKVKNLETGVETETTADGISQILK